MKFILSYKLPYIHIVEVGIIADSEQEAISKAHHLADVGELFDNHENQPLLKDVYDEDDGETTLEFVVEDVFLDRQEWPNKHYTILQMEKDKAAHRAAGLLIDAYKRGEKTCSIDWEDIDLAYAEALKSRE